MIEKTFGRPPQAVQAEPSPQAPHAALLVDFDNVTMGIRSDLQTQLRKLLNSAIIRGKVSVQRAYADWRRYPQYIVPLTEASIDLIFAPAVGANKKNATDIRLAIDALELVFTRPEIGTFILLSGDSDFSALVLKLKEYGKFVIGVGIRESSSDLLVQNCDEYYSYNELTGLSRTGEEEKVRHDPWELAVAAVQKMLQSGDVMRSDRLKQVMQSIDPNFDEKDAGCNRFSKFVVAAEKRGLLRLTKMENGQYAVDIGPNANVPIDQQTSTEAKPGAPETTATAPRRKRPARTRTQRETKVRTLTLSESFDLLKRALIAAGAVGDEATVADRARDGMIEIHGNESDPAFEAKRFQRMLRQAHDADIIELIKSNGEDYMLKLSAAAVAEMDSATDAAEKADAEATPKRKTTKRKTTKKTTRATAKEVEEGVEAGAVEDSELAPAGEKEESVSEPKKATKRKTTKRKTTKKTTRATAKKVEEGVEAEAVGEKEESVSEPKKAAKRKTTKKKTTRSKAKKTDESAAEVAVGAAGSEESKSAPPIVNPRFRRGSRSAKPKPATEKAAEEDAKEEAPPAATPSLKASTAPRSLGRRSGSRSARHAAKKPVEEEKSAKEPVEAPKPEPDPVQIDEPRAPAQEVVSKPEPKPEAAPIAKPEPSSEPEEDGSGLFRRVTAAFQRAISNPKEEDE